MKASDSATSLTQLTVCDTGCLFCTEGSDAETAKVLVDSKTFLSCGCRFATHVQCWTKYLDRFPNHERPTCPNCDTPVTPWRRPMTEIDVVSAEEARMKQSQGTMRILAITLIVILAIVIFIVSMLFGRRAS